MRKLRLVLLIASAFVLPGLSEVFARPSGSTLAFGDPYWGSCSYTCEPCFYPGYGTGDCPPYSGFPQQCLQYCP